MAAAVCYFVPAVFQGLQVLLLRQIIDSVVAGVQSGAIVGQVPDAVKSISPDSGWRNADGMRSCCGRAANMHASGGSRRSGMYDEWALPRYGIK